MKIAEVLMEAGMLDVSIKNIDKEINTPEKKVELLNSTVKITEKYDGTKLSIYRNDQPYNKDYRKNWIVSYKNNIIYSSEFSGVNDVTGSIGTSQYKLVHEHLKKVHSKTKSIPNNMEFFIEFIMSKPTLTRDYKKKHGLVLLAYSPTEIKVKHGKVTSNPDGFHTAELDKYASILQMKTPKVMYAGPLKDVVRARSNNASKVLADVKHTLLSTQSELGGPTEGVVIELDNGQLYKFLQADQHDNATRSARKLKYRGTPDEEKQYWANVRNIAVKIVSKIPKNDLNSALKQLSNVVYSKNIPINHGKKQGIQIKDDLFLTAKTILIKNLKGNNGAIFIGRFSPPTKAHMQIVQAAVKTYDTVTLNIVKSGKNDGENPFPLDLQMRMWLTVFPNLTIQTSRSANVITILNKASNNVNTLLAGSDRVEMYNQQLSRMPDVKVQEVPRTAEDISASKVRKALADNDVEIFKQQMHPKTYKFYKELKQYV